MDEIMVPKVRDHVTCYVILIAVWACHLVIVFICGKV